MIVLEAGYIKIKIEVNVEALLNVDELMFEALHVDALMLRNKEGRANGRRNTVELEDVKDNDEVD